MKIFWSWQSDHDDKISHYLVRDALQAAIGKLRVPEEIEEPSEAERRANLELDHDTKGETGWTDIADSIFRKIDCAAVFVADVTPVGNPIYPIREDAGDGRAAENDRALSSQVSARAVLRYAARSLEILETVIWQPRGKKWL